MKHQYSRILQYLVMVCIAASSLFAQQSIVYNNEWVDYDKTYYKIRSSHNGLLKIPYAALQEQGLPSDPNGYKVIRNGKEIPLFIPSAGVLIDDDYIGILANKNDGFFDTQLYFEPEHQPMISYSLFTDTASYFLYYDNTATSLRFTEQDNDVSQGSVTEDYFMHRIYESFPENFFSGKPIRSLGGVNNYFADFEPGEGFTSTIFHHTNDKNIDFICKFVNDNGPSARVETKTVGKSDDVYNITDHHLQIAVNNNTYVDDTFEGYDMNTYSFELPLSEVDNVTTIQYQTLGDLIEPNTPSEYKDSYSVIYSQIEYPRDFNFDGSKNFSFQLSNADDRYIEIFNFNGGEQPVLFDSTNHKYFIPVLENGYYKVFIPQEGMDDNRSFVMMNTTNESSSVDVATSNIKERNFIPLHQEEYAAELLMIYNQKITGGDVNQVQRYKDYRLSEAGGSHTVLDIEIEEIYDQFSYGIHHHCKAIQNFVNYCVDHETFGYWSEGPTHLLLLGKSMKYSTLTHDFNYSLNHVPTYGHKGSDNMLASRSIYSYQPQVAVGRISAIYPYELKNYLDKVIEYEQHNNANYCTKDEKIWMKHLVHLAGAKNTSERDSFITYLKRFEDIAESYFMGAETVFSYSLETSDLLVPSSQTVENYINEGIAMITFMGHSQANGWTFDLEGPENYDNNGRYPFIVSNSCFVGDVHQETTTPVMARTYTNAEAGGSIGFLATVGFGFPSFLEDFCTELYKQFAQISYGKTIGTCIQKTIAKLAENDSDGIKITCQEFTLIGDPLIEIYNFEKPDYLIESEDVKFDPQVITSANLNFKILVDAYNLGMALPDSVEVLVERELPSGEMIEVFNGKVGELYYKKELSFTATNALEGVFGLNKIHITLDPENKIEEDCENNNTMVKTINVFPNTAVPIQPCNFSIVNSPNVVLKAAASLKPSNPVNYVLQMDTTELFNSEFLLETIVSDGATGLVEWQPTTSYFNNRVYYWRIGEEKENDEDVLWESSSFVYLASTDNGWNQSHYFQYAKNLYSPQIEIAENRKFEYEPVLNEISVFNVNPIYANNYASAVNGIRNDLNGNAVANGTCINEQPCRGGLFFEIYTPNAYLEYITSVQESNSPGKCNDVGTYGSVHCGGGKGFEFPTGDTQGWENILEMLEDIPNGHFLLVYSIFDGRCYPISELSSAQQPVFTIFEQLGWDELTNATPEVPFAAVARKGDPNFVAEVIFAEDVESTLDADFEIFSSQNNGVFRSPLIGPSNGWNNMVLDYESLLSIEEEDELQVTVIGVDHNFSETELFTTEINQFEVDLSIIDFVQYPYIKLSANTKDIGFQTPPQLEYWRVFFDAVPEFMFDFSKEITFMSDSLPQGAISSIDYSVANIVGVNGDSLLVQYALTTSSNEDIILDEIKYAPIQANESIDIHYEFSTMEYSGDNVLSVTINPNHDQPEKFDFNNYQIFGFYVVGDNINPLLDVTFDGVHILDGDIVSAKPEIIVALKDENDHFALTDESLIDVTLIYPNGDEIIINFAELEWAEFVPASQEMVEERNVAQIILTPDFLDIYEEDDIYELRVNAKDMSGNSVSGLDYITSFEIVHKSMISNLLTYPNPFTSQAKFVFTLTGSEVPDVFTIQILTTTGKVIREITKHELGNLHVGRNITEYAWDGTDEFGNNVGKGIYFYRVITSLDNQEIDQYSNASTKKMDDLFNKYRIGKMYKLY